MSESRKSNSGTGDWGLGIGDREDLNGDSNPTQTLQEFFPSTQSPVPSPKGAFLPPRPLRLLTFLLVLSVVGTQPSIAADSRQLTAESLSLVQQGRELYEAGQFLEASTIWRQASRTLKSNGDVLNQAMALSLLSLAYQQLGQWNEAGIAIASSLQLLENSHNADHNPERLKVLAQALNTQGSLQLAKGQPEQAFVSWEQAGALYQKVGDSTGFYRAKINQAQALQVQGLYRRTLDTLTEIDKNLQTQPDSPIKAAGLRSLGNALRLVGDLDRSRQVLEQSLSVAQRLSSNRDIGEAYASLGNTARAQKKNKEALGYYQQASTSGTEPTVQLQSLLNQLSLLVETRQYSEAQTLSPQIQSRIANLPLSRNSIDARINFAQSLIKLSGVSSDRTLSGQETSIQLTEIGQLLATAVQQAKSLGDQRAESYALGQLGGVYEQTQQLDAAIKLTQQALLLSQSINAPEIAYRWQWQLGRLLSARGDTKEAIAAYTEAVNNLQSLRTDLVAINNDVQFSFRESVEPVYRQLVGLLLQPKSGTEPSQENLIAARKVIESLQLAELANFFRENCLTAKPVQIDQVDPQAAVVYPIILEDRLEVVLSLPGGKLHHYTTPVPRREVENTLDQLRKGIVTRTSNRYLPLSQKVYDWLVRPATTYLAASKIETLVFVLDGRLTNVPMAALHDGEKFLVERYAIALTPSLQLFDPKPLAQKRITALTAGLSEARQEFSSLPNVQDELAQISSRIPTEVLLNQTFTSTGLKKMLESSAFPIVHLATHGQFSSQADQTFLLTWDGTFKVNELDNLLRSRQERGSSAIELLVLSACQTAAGDSRAALGLAGVAVRAGARSTLATLWSVNDEGTTVLMNQFYSELGESSMTKAQSLRHAQQKLLGDRNYRHPYYWAPYVLVGNWL